MRTTAMPLSRTRLIVSRTFWVWTTPSAAVGSSRKTTLSAHADGPGDRDLLPLATGHRADRGRRPSAPCRPSSAKPAAALSRIAFLSMNPSWPSDAASRDLTAEEHVLHRVRGAAPARGPGRPPPCPSADACCGVGCGPACPRRRSRPRRASRLPVSALTSVDLPAPLSPIRATTSPGLTSKSAAGRARGHARSCGTVPSLRGSVQSCDAPPCVGAEPFSSVLLASRDPARWPRGPESRSGTALGVTRD